MVKESTHNIMQLRSIEIKDKLVKELIKANLIDSIDDGLYSEYTYYPLKITDIKIDFEKAMDLFKKMNKEELQKAISVHFDGVTNDGKDKINLASVFSEMLEDAKYINSYLYDENGETKIFNYIEKNYSKEEIGKIVYDTPKMNEGQEKWLLENLKNTVNGLFYKNISEIRYTDIIVGEVNIKGIRYEIELQNAMLPLDKNNKLNNKLISQNVDLNDLFNDMMLSLREKSNTLDKENLHSVFLKELDTFNDKLEYYKNHKNEEKRYEAIQPILSEFLNVLIEKELLDNNYVATQTLNNVVLNKDKIKLLALDDIQELFTEITNDKTFKEFPQTLSKEEMLDKFKTYVINKYESISAFNNNRLESEIFRELNQHFIENKIYKINEFQKQCLDLPPLPKIEDGVDEQNNRLNIESAYIEAVKYIVDNVIQNKKMILNRDTLKINDVEVENVLNELINGEEIKESLIKDIENVTLKYVEKYDVKEIKELINDNKFEENIKFNIYHNFINSNTLEAFIKSNIITNTTSDIGDYTVLYNNAVGIYDYSNENNTKENNKNNISHNISRVLLENISDENIREYTKDYNNKYVENDLLQRDFSLDTIIEKVKKGCDYILDDDTLNIPISREIFIPFNLREFDNTVDNMLEQQPNLDVVKTYKELMKKEIQNLTVDNLTNMYDIKTSERESLTRFVERSKQLINESVVENLTNVELIALNLYKNGKDNVTSDNIVNYINERIDNTFTHSRFNANTYNDKEYITNVLNKDKNTFADYLIDNDIIKTNVDLDNTEVVLSKQQENHILEKVEQKEKEKEKEKKNTISSKISSWFKR